MSMLSKEDIAGWMESLQDDICRQLSAADGQGSFREDRWQRPAGGGGRTRILEGRHIEKGGVNFSAVWGPLPEKIGQALKVDAGQFFATGVSIVLHPSNPYVPIIHMNVRYFEMNDGRWWFGGGIDLTPHYVNLEEARFFHETLQTACDKHDETYYPRFKQWADDYFYLPHRKETRGIGGIFFDRLGPESPFTKASRWAFVQEIGQTFCPVYLPLLAANKDRPFSDRESHWQSLRRGRYVEFNLLWDKGTKFGLDTDGRTASILMSLPPMAQWPYEFIPEPGSPEEFTQSILAVRA
ncbi:MAG: oxygen-dependent coproporphyrinogen oxidase [Saprospiraceae bacterium]|nr:oxygen-dependent coproporphyrinogen oxidase [Saprospiraceae bacterium]